MLLPLLAVALAGCKTPYVAPCLTGRVLDAKTHQPLANVKVRRVEAGQSAEAPGEIHGAEALLKAPIVWTGQDGRFMVDGERALTLFGGSGWYAVTISFERAGYQVFLTNYTLLNVTTNSPNGAPRIETGDILLRSFSR